MIINPEVTVTSEVDNSVRTNSLKYQFTFEVDKNISDIDISY